MNTDTNQKQNHFSSDELRRRGIHSAIRIGKWGTCLLLIGLFAPYAGQQSGRSFFQVAQDSSWKNLADWPAVWSSVKIILIFLGSALLIDCAARLVILYRHANLVWPFTVLTYVAGLGLLIGIYYFARALF
jgi:hypothetical protein